MAISATLNAEGDQTLYSGGTATGTTVNNDNIQIIFGGGRACGITVNSGVLSASAKAEYWTV